MTREMNRPIEYTAMSEPPGCGRYVLLIGFSFLAMLGALVALAMVLNGCSATVDTEPMDAGSDVSDGGRDGGRLRRNLPSDATVDARLVLR